ncbi:RNA-binding protein [bacterium]|nr:RNA-binding protein [bacterium]MBU1637294.1 RNA-binding protein [bacterium]MBU1920947.1 RNA-binding protein [bacterium]
MSKKLYVGNLPFSATEDEIRTLFSEYGTVDTVELLMDRDSGRPRGFGFVQMNEADASRAISGLDGKDMGGRALRVNEAKDRAERSSRSPRESRDRW